MKKSLIAIIGVIIFHTNVIFAESNYDLYRRALSKGPTGTLDITVVDEKGIPVEDVFAEAWFWTSRSWFWSFESDGPDADDETDENGHVVLKAKSQSDAHYSLKKKGYYTSRERHNFISGTFDCVKETFWGYEWIPPYKETIALKTIRNPIPMYACRLSNSHFKLPDFNQAYPFDLQKMDWCKPHGKGIRDDVYICVTSALNKVNGFIESSIMTLNFKHKDEGLYSVNKDQFSTFWSDYDVNIKERYQSTITYEKNDDGYFGEHTHYSVFRIRCKHDEDGQLLSAHYGKMYGTWSIASQNGIGNVSIYFNPTPNDTNLEYDPEKNLYKGDTYEEIRQSRVYAP